MSKHYPELHKIIMSALETGDFVVSSIDNNEMFWRDVVNDIRIPAAKKYIRIYRKQFFFEGAPYDPAIEIHAGFIEKSWFFGAEKWKQTIDIEKLLTSNEMERIQDILRKEYLEFRMKNTRESMDRRNSIDEKIAGKIRKSMSER